MSKTKTNSTKKAPSLIEFRTCVFDSYAPVIHSMGFVELKPRQGEYVNDFSVRIGNDTTVIEVDGINYGFHAWTKIFRASAADDDRYGLPIYKLLQQRQGLNAKEIRQLHRREQNCADQLEEVREKAKAILSHAKDVLSGDFSTLDKIAEQERHLQQEQLAKALPSEQKAAVVAATEAGHAFKRGDFHNVVALLEPHLSRLPASQQKRFELAKIALVKQQQ